MSFDEMMKILARMTAGGINRVAIDKVRPGRLAIGPDRELYRISVYDQGTLIYFGEGETFLEAAGNLEKAS